MVTPTLAHPLRASRAPQVELVGAPLTTAPNTTAPLVPGSPHALVMGPVTFARDKGKPRTVTMEFSTTGFDGPFVAYMRNGTVEGDKRVSSAEVRLNGNLLFRPSDFSEKRSGTRLPVSLPEHSILEVRLASGPGSELTVWIAGNPRLQIQLDEAGSVTREMPVDGGAICTNAAEGAEMCLTIPPGALLKAQEIRLTPIQAIPNLPLTHGFRYGVEMEPHGTQFLLPAMLEIRPASPAPEGMTVGFAYEGMGQDFHLRPLGQVDGVIQMPVAYFSGLGVGAGTADDLSQIIDTAPPASVRQYSDQLTQLSHTAGPPSDQNVEMYRAVFGEWFSIVVLPYLSEALQCGFSDCPDFAKAFWAAIGLWTYWNAELQGLTLDQDPYLSSLGVSYLNHLRQGFERLFTHWDLACRGSSVFCEQDALTDRFSMWVNVAQLWLDNSPDPFEWCGGIMSMRVNSVDLDPLSLRIKYYDLAEISLIARNAERDVIADPPSLAVTWTSADKDIAVVDTPVSPRTAEVSGMGVGRTTLTATVEQCGRHPFSPVAAVEVVCPVRFIEVNPSGLHLKVNDEARVDVILLDEDRYELKGSKYPVTFTPSGRGVAIAADVDPLSNRRLARVRALQGGIVTVEVAAADCDARASFEVSIEAQPKSLTVDKRALSLKVGESAVLRATVTNDDGSENTTATVKWQPPRKLSPPADVAVEAIGPREATVRAHSVGLLTHGRAEITATVEPPDVESTITSLPVTVQVTPKVVGALATLSAPLVTEGRFVSAEAEALNENGSTVWVPALWTHQPDASTPGQVRLERDASGLVQVFGVAPGLVWLTASIGPPDVEGDFVSAPVLLRVLPLLPPVVSVELKAQYSLLAVGVSSVLTAVPRFVDGGTHADVPVSWRLEYDTSKAVPASLQTSGQTAAARGIAAGTAWVTAIVEPPFASVPVASDPVRLTVVPPVASAGVDISGCPVYRESYRDCWLSVGETAWLNPTVTLADGGTTASVPVSWDVRANPLYPSPGLAAIGIQLDGNRLRVRGVDVGIVEVTPVVNPPFADPPLRGRSVSVNASRSYLGTLNFSASYSNDNLRCAGEISGTRAARFSASYAGVGLGLFLDDYVTMPLFDPTGLLCDFEAPVSLSSSFSPGSPGVPEYTQTRARLDYPQDSGFACGEYDPQTGYCASHWVREIVRTTADLSWNGEASGSATYRKTLRTGYCNGDEPCDGTYGFEERTTSGQSFTSLRLASAREWWGLPTLEIQAPPPDVRFRAGENVTVSGSATPSYGSVTPNIWLSWTVLFRHGSRTRVYLGPTPGESVSFTYPGPEDLASAATSYVEVRLTAADRFGFSTTVSHNLLPRTVDLTFATSPPGRRLVVQSVDVTAPRTFTSWEGHELTLEAPDQSDAAGASYTFSSWSDGGARTHTITTPAVPTTYTATFLPW